MDKEALKKSVNLNLRCVTQSCKGGVPLIRLEKDYKALIGKPIPLNDLGYNSIELFLQSIPDVVRLKKDNGGQITVEGVADASTAHIASLISKQKKSKTGKGTSKKPSLSVKKYSCQDSWRSSASTSSGIHKKDNKASNPQPPKLKIPVLNSSFFKLTDSEYLTFPTPHLDNSQKLTNMQQGTSQSSNSMLEAGKKITLERNEGLIKMPNTPPESGLTVRQLARWRTKMRKAAQDLIKTSELALTNEQLEDKILKAQEINMTTEMFLEWLKASSSNSLTSTENQDPAKYTELLQKQDKQRLRSRTLRNLWHVAFRFEEGILLAKLPNEYMTLYGTPIPCKELGYKTLKTFLQAIPDVIRLRRDNGADWAEAVRDTNSLASGLASQQKEIPSTSTDSINCQSGWETSSNSSSMSNTSKTLPAPDLKKCVEQSLESIQSVLSSYSTITSIPSPVTKPKSVLPSSSQFTPCESVSSKDLNLSKLRFKPTLNSFPKIKSSIESAEFNSLLLMNMLLYGDDSFVGILKRGILAFDGFSFSEDSDECKQKQLLLSMLPVDTLKECLKLLCIECDSNNKQVLSYKIMQFLSSSGKALSERKI